MNKIFARDHKQAWLHLGLLAIAIVIAYSKIFHAGFMSWDDGEYVLHNKDITAISGTNISAWFSGFYVGNYQPLTMLSYAIDMAIGGHEAFIYHFTSLLLHIFNSWLLYLFIRNIQRNDWIALFVALLFALHPSQTESVSWIAERKTVLSAFFCLLALWQYTKYVRRPSAKKLTLIIILGVAAMLSKAVAVTLPLSLLAADIWLQRDLRNRKVWQEKIPLFIAALVLGIVAIKAQSAGKFLNLHPEYNWFDTLVYAAYAYVQYIIHLFVPVQLSVVYPYPQSAGFIQYLYLLIAVSILGLAVVAWRKKWYVLCGGIVFYTVNIVLLLQFIQFGESLMADRYVYVAGIGIFFPAIYYLFVWLQKRAKQTIAIAGSSVVAGVFLIMTFLRNDIWLSDLNFFTAIVDTFPNSAVAQYSVGALYMKMGDYQQAQEHIDLAVAIDPGNYKAWHNKGALLMRQGKAAEALDALNKCLAINDYPKAYFTRAMLYQGMGKPELAIADIDKVLETQPQNARAYYIKADCLEKEGNTTAAMDNYDKAIGNDGADPLFYIRRGLIFLKLNNNNSALSDLNTAVELSPDNGEALYYRGMVKYRSGQNACDDLHSALSHGYKQAQDAIGKVCGGH